MHIVDILIFIVYMVVMLGIGFFFLGKNKDADDYYVGGRNMGSLHIGLSVVATDVGGGFSIALGGLGFIMGLSGSWMLFTGLIGAWLSAVVLIPKIKGDPRFQNLFTFPQIFIHLFDKRVALAAGVISAIGYIGFTASQIMAGAKLASATVTGLEHTYALVIMGVIAIVYTVLGGIKAVIYTDTAQWIILMGGLVLIGIPISYYKLGGYESIVAALPPDMFSFTNLTWQKLVSWMATIIPIWFIGMTLYQRIYACRDEKTAKRAWFIAGLFEWPVMAFMGVIMGLFARVAAEQGMFMVADHEEGLPILLNHILPVGLLGLMLSAYFSAILSTADSCLMAASGNVVSDLLCKLFPIKEHGKSFLRLSQGITLLLGIVALMLATVITSVLELMLLSYAFMVSGLLVPVIGGLFWRRSTPAAALTAMIVGGGTTVLLLLLKRNEILDKYWGYGLDENIYGLTAAAVVFIAVSLSAPKKVHKEVLPLDR